MARFRISCRSSPTISLVEVSILTHSQQGSEDLIESGRISVIYKKVRSTFSAQKTRSATMGPLSLTRSARAPNPGGVPSFRVTLLAVLAAALAGCASQAPPAPGSQVSPSAAQLTPEQSDTALDKLWQQRASEQKDLTIGPGDMLEISVPNVRELKDRNVRVDGKGDITLPLVGSFHVAGLTEPEIINQLANALHKYVYHPEINLLVKSYSSRVVGVMGAVHAPGLYVLNGPSDTVRDLIERAGGLSDNAGREVLLNPARAGSNDDSMLAQQADNGATMPKPPEAPTAALGAVDNSSARSSGAVTNTAVKGNYTPWVRPPSENEFDAGSAYVIALDGDSPYRRYVNLQVRPGDTLYVPPAGQTSVVGWVYKPTVLPVTHGLTALSAVSAAGGMLFAADPTTVKIMRHEPGDQTKVIQVNLAAVQQGEAPDVALQANDVVDVGYSAVKIPGYALYLAAQGLATMGPAAAMMSAF